MLILCKVMFPLHIMHVLELLWVCRVGDSAVVIFCIMFVFYTTNVIFSEIGIGYCDILQMGVAPFQKWQKPMFMA